MIRGKRYVALKEKPNLKMVQNQTTTVASPDRNGFFKFEVVFDALLQIKATVH